MPQKRIVRPKEAWTLIACGRTKFSNDYSLRDPQDPFIPGTKVKRLRPLRLGPRNVGYLSEEIDALINSLAAQRDAPSKKRVA
jgi:hypothetical protein